MSITIDLSNLKACNNASVLTSTVISHSKGEININAPNVELSGNTSLLDNAKIGSVLDELNQKSKLMNQNSKEYTDVQKILNIPRNNTKEINRNISKHIREFSMGVLASIVANLLT